MEPLSGNLQGAILGAMDRTLTVTGNESDDRGDRAPTGGIDAPSFAQLYERYLAGMYRYFLAHTRNGVDAADLTQQVFVQALAAWPRYHGEGLTVRPWLFRIAHNVLVDSYRRRHPTVSWEDMPADRHPVAGDDTEMAVLRRDEARNLEAVMAGLPPDKRELLVMRFAAGLTVREMADALDRKDEAVRSELRRLLHLLKEKLTDE